MMKQLHSMAQSSLQKSHVLKKKCWSSKFVWKVIDYY